MFPLSSPKYGIIMYLSVLVKNNKRQIFKYLLEIDGNPYYSDHIGMYMFTEDPRKWILWFGMIEVVAK